MALGTCGRFLRGCSFLSARATVSALQESASCFLTAGNVGCTRRGRTGFLFTPACFISSEAFLSRLKGGKVADGSALRLPASVPADGGEQLSLLMRHPDQPHEPKVLKVAVIGAPNAGKSTLSNQLLGRKVFAVSKKVHTTRARALGVLTENNTQIILLDTPGLTPPSKAKRHQLEKSLLVDPWNSVKEADLMVVLVDVADRWACSRMDVEVLKCLAQHPQIPAVLVLNKSYFMAAAKPGAWQYHSEVLTDQSPEEVCTNLIREKLLEYLPQEVPYSLTQTIELWQEGMDGEVDISVKLYTKKESHMKMVIGASGQMVAQIAREAGEDLSRVILREVRLKITAKLKK
uniref:GTPase Era, mitochondrial n=1 Tax=Oryzias melastigma TaxID=30732 RepID=A0A3B3BMU5_ORYME